MNVVSVEDRGAYLAFYVAGFDDPFVYPADKFSSRGAVIAEIKKHISARDKRVNRFNGRKNVVKGAFNARN